METQETKDGGKGCCDTAKKCCGGKALAALALLAVGGIGGYFCGRCCTAKEAAAPAVATPAQTPAK